MFDPVTAEFLQSAPSLPDLDSTTLPQVLTRHFAELVARRLRGVGLKQQVAPEERWPLTRIAGAYEILASIEKDEALRKAAAFVAGTAHQILSQAEEKIGSPKSLLSRDHLDATLASVLLFMSAGQYADANEAARKVAITEKPQDLHDYIAAGIRDFGSGQPASILSRAVERKRLDYPKLDIQEAGLAALLDALLIGIEMFAAEVMGELPPGGADLRFNSAAEAFKSVLDLSSGHYEVPEQNLSIQTTYPGPRHAAALLLSAYQATANVAVVRLPAPPGVDGDFWWRWLRRRATSAPFLWANHIEAIAKGFHRKGTSAVLILPTGAGKTTVSCLKIAATIGCGRSVVFVAPTHALVEQLKNDLQEIFPEELLGSVVSADADLLFAESAALKTIEVMTPEGCLALLSYAPEAFRSVGLMVFDECHMLSPTSGLRRALDGMFCILAFNSYVPEADFLFLSAMVKNGDEFSSWIGQLTGRTCLFVDPLWKPSRQARGVVCYREESLREILESAGKAQDEADAAQGKNAKGVRRVAARELTALPYVLFGLRHNWLNQAEQKTECSIAKILDERVELDGNLRNTQIRLLPNVNGVAAHLAAEAARNGLKTIVFVNVKSHTVKTAGDISTLLGGSITPTADEEELWSVLDMELGGLRHSVLSKAAIAVPHNAQMLRLERDLAERMFRRPDGAKVIVATPTLAQGLNLPAHLAILASDMRAEEGGGRKRLGAHEILNAAARAGRAGHLANGVVLMIPERIVTFRDKGPLSLEAIQRLQALLPEDDRCIEVSDPLQVVLDRLSMESIVDRDVEYALNRLSMTGASETTEDVNSAGVPIAKSLGAFVAAKNGNEQVFAARVASLNSALAQRQAAKPDLALLELAAQSGVSFEVIGGLRERLEVSPETLPLTVMDWTKWIVEWLASDVSAREAFLGREKVSLMNAVGRAADSEFTGESVCDLLPGLNAWLSGEPLCNIEKMLGGDPLDELICPRARRLVSSLIPMGVSFVAGVVAKLATGVLEGTSNEVCPALEILPTALRRGFDTPFKVAFAEVQRGLKGRVQIHREYAAVVGGSLVRTSEKYLDQVSTMRALLEFMR